MITVRLNHQAAYNHDIDHDNEDHNNNGNHKGAEAKVPKKTKDRKTTNVSLCMYV